MFYLLIIIYFLLFIYLAWKNTKWGLFLVSALLPTYLIRFSLLSFPLTLLEGMIWILFVIWLVKLKKEYHLTFNPIIWIKNIRNCKSKNQNSYNPIPKLFWLPIILLLIASTISIFVAPNFNAAAGVWKAYFVEAVMFLIILVYTLKTKADIKNLINALSLTVIIIGLFAIIQKFTGALIFNPFWQAEGTRRITTFFGYPNANALFVLPVIFLALSNLISNRFKNIPSLLAIILGITTIILAKSTGGLIGLAVGTIALLIFYKKTRLIILSLAALVIIIGIFTPAVTDKIQQTYISVAENHLPIAPTNWQLRAQQWREATKMLTQAPILGAGLAGYQKTVEPYHVNSHIEIFLYPHNFFLNFWTETGLLGLISIAWILIVFFYLAYRADFSVLTLVTSSAMIALLIHGLVDVPYFKNDLSVLFWILIGIIIIIYNQNSDRHSGASAIESGRTTK